MRQIYVAATLISADTMLQLGNHDIIIVSVLFTIIIPSNKLAV